jgi:putative copper export protein
MRVVAYVFFGLAAYAFLSRGMSALVNLNAGSILLVVVILFFVGLGTLALRYAEKKEDEQLNKRFEELSK